MRFPEALETCLQRIPSGKVATCGAVAEALGDVRAARTVATWLLDHPEVPGGHRVVRADGRPVLWLRRAELEAEGVALHRGNVPAERFTNRVSGVPLLVELRREQVRLSASVREEDPPEPPRILAGADVAYEGDRAVAVAVSMDAETLEPFEIAERDLDVDFPYIPTYLAFRELPGIEAAVRGLHSRPDALFIDGHGRLHPALFGLACFAGVRLDLPTVGIAKHPLVGRPVPSKRDATRAIPVEFKGSVRGYAWAPPGSSRPFYISVGHRLSLKTALRLSQRATKERYPEPLRLADRLSKERKRMKKAERAASGRTA